MRNASTRRDLGLPSANTGESVTHGRVRDWAEIFCKRADPCEGDPGGDVEYWVPDPQRQIEIIDTSRLPAPY